VPWHERVHWTRAVVVVLVLVALGNIETIVRVAILERPVAGWPSTQLGTEANEWRRTPRDYVMRAGHVIYSSPLERPLAEAVVGHAPEAVLDPNLWGILAKEASEASDPVMTTRLEDRERRARNRIRSLGDTLVCLSCTVRGWISERLGMSPPAAEAQLLSSAAAIGAMSERIITAMAAPSPAPASVELSERKALELSGQLEGAAALWRRQRRPRESTRQEFLDAARMLGRAEVVIDAAGCRLSKRTCPLLQPAAAAIAARQRRAP